MIITMISFANWYIVHSCPVLLALERGLLRKEVLTSLVKNKAFKSSLVSHAWQLEDIPTRSLSPLKNYVHRSSICSCSEGLIQPMGICANTSLVWRKEIPHASRRRKQLSMLACVTSFPRGSSHWSHWGWPAGALRYLNRLERFHNSTKLRHVFSFRQLRESWQPKISCCHPNRSIRGTGRRGL